MADYRPMPAPTSTLYRIADDRLGGKLAERLTELRADDRSWRWIARKLAPEFGFAVNAETLRQWGEALGIPERTMPEAVGQ